MPLLANLRPHGKAGHVPFPLARDTLIVITIPECPGKIVVGSKRLLLFNLCISCQERYR